MSKQAAFNLTPTDLAILRGYAAGLEDREIAEQCGKTYSRIAKIGKVLRCSLGARNRAQAAVLAVHAGIITADGAEPPTVQPAPQRTEQPAIDDLTRRQRQVLALLADGLTQRQIAKLLYIDEATVRNHSMRMRRALRANNCAHAVSIGYRAELLPMTAGAR